MKKGDFTFLGGLVVGAAMLVMLGAALYWFRAETLPSEESYAMLVDKMNRLDSPGASYVVSLTMEEKGSAFLFFNKEATSLTSIQNGVEYVFERPKSCPESGCVCNCIKYADTTSEKTHSIVCDEKTACVSNIYTFYDSAYYEKDSPHNNGQVVHNLGGGASKVDVQLEPFQQRVIVLCERQVSTETGAGQPAQKPSKDCITPDLRRFLTFDKLLSQNLQLCTLDPYSCQVSQQTLAKIIDSEHSVTVQPSVDKIKISLMKGTEEWGFEQKGSACLSDKREEKPAEQTPFTIQYDASLGIVVKDKGVLDEITAYKDKMCFVYATTLTS